MATVLGPPSYWCHQCHRSVRPDTGNDFLCPFCNGGFIEEIENNAGTYFPPHRDRSSIVFGGEPGSQIGRDGRGIAANEDGLSPALHRLAAGAQGGRNPPMFQVLQAMSAVLQQGRHEVPGPGRDAQEHGRDADGHVPDQGGLVDPMLLVHNMFAGVRGGNVEVFFDNGTGVGPRLLPANFGDYFFGPGLDQLIQQLAENDPNRYGTPPASKAAIDAMPTIHVTSEHMGTDAAQCAVCKDEFDLGSQVRQMPCKHLYHGDCILPWLSEHNSCPVCRFEMPTDDPDHNRESTSQNSQPAGARGGNTDGGRGSRGFTIWGSPRGGFTMSRDDAGGEAAGQDGGSTRLSEESPGGGTGSRRPSFQFPWPYGSSNSPPRAAASSNVQAGASGSIDRSRVNAQGGNAGAQDSNVRDDLPD